jgi:lysylphosphatidylglycerol synthetase-like protein (DUF2156 family)
MDQIDSLLQRPKLYNNIDGVGELSLGSMFASCAILLWIQLHAAPNSIWNKSYTILIFWGLVIAVIHYGSKAIKNRITYPRTGYVEYRRRDMVLIPMILGAAVTALIAAGLWVAIRRHWYAASPLALFGLILAAGYGIRIARVVPWKLVIAAAMASASLAIAFLPPRWFAAVAGDSWTPHMHFSGPLIMGSILLLFGAYGILFLASGGISFWLYLRHTQSPCTESE